jgi:hypothetical protein
MNGKGLLENNIVIDTHLDLAVDVGLSNFTPSGW